jgi:hypothetical protein
MPRSRERFKLLARKTHQGRTVWYARYYDRSGRRLKVSTGKEKKGEAREFAEQLLEDGVESSIRLEEFAKDFFRWDTCSWIQRQHAKDRSFGEYQARMRRAHLDGHILPEFGKKRLAELTGPAIERWLLRLPLANQTKNHILYTFKIVLREAKRERLIRESPLQESEPLARNAKGRDVLTMEELGKLFPKTDKKLLEI